MGKLDKEEEKNIAVHCPEKRADWIVFFRFLPRYVS